MTPQTLLIDRNFKGVGRIKRATGTANPRVRHAMSRMLTEFHHQGRLDLLRAIRDGRISLLQAYDAHQRNAVASLPIAATAAPLVEKFRAWIVDADCSDKHRVSLGTSCDYIAKAAPNAMVADLPEILERLRDTLGAKHQRSFNLARAAALAFVRGTLKKAHPLWAAVAAVEPRKVVRQRQGQPLSIRQMRSFFPNPETDNVDAIAWTLALTGMGLQEYWGRWAVGDGRVHIEGTKRRGRVRDVPLVRVPAVPMMHRQTFEKKFRERFSGRITPYDLRRTFAHWLEIAGVIRTRRRIYMGHGTGDVTGLYERHEVADYLATDAERLRDLVDEQFTVETAEQRPRRRQGVMVYFVSTTAGMVKIGSAVDVLARLGELQVGSPVTLALLGVIDGGRLREKQIHKQFAHLRVRGEWFRGTPELSAYIKKVCAAHTKRTMGTDDVPPDVAEAN